MAIEPTQFVTGQNFALTLDKQDPLAHFRDEFIFPKKQNNEPYIYLCGNSLGLQPKKVKSYIEQELSDWSKYGVLGHLRAKNPWYSYHELLTKNLSHIVGAKGHEVVVMNTLSVNLHLMMVSFYQPTATRNKIIIEGGAFPSDQYAVQSQIKFHGFDPKSSLIEVKPKDGESTLTENDFLETIEKHGNETALVLIGNVNYLTGQAFSIKSLTEKAHSKGCKIGFDLAHGAGNLQLRLHDDGPDFAVWCSYKYLNGGPGSLGGVFVHERHSKDFTLPRFAGWWGHNKVTRFEMSDQFEPMIGAEGWQLSNPPIFQLAALKASLEIFEEASMNEITAKSNLMTGYLEFLVSRCPDIEIITPKNRGAQLSLRFKNQTNTAGMEKKLEELGIIVDFRNPNIIRAAPAPLYCKFLDIYRFWEAIDEHAKK